MMTRRTWWTPVFLTLTATAVGMELWAAWDNTPDTVPWTYLAVRYLPEAVTTAAVGALVSWLPTHFRQAYADPPEETRPMSRYAKFVVAALGAAATAAIPLAADGRITGQEGLMVAAAALGAVAVLLVPNARRAPDDDTR
jgi:hypothetical protein